MNEYIETRVIQVAEYILKTGATVRQAAKEFRISKSTVHKDITERIVELNPSLAKQVRSVLRQNMDERNIRGGMATKLKYKGNKKSRRTPPDVLMNSLKY